MGLGGVKHDWTQGSLDDSTDDDGWGEGGRGTGDGGRAGALLGDDRDPSPPYRRDMARAASRSAGVPRRRTEEGYRQIMVPGDQTVMIQLVQEDGPGTG